MNRAQAGEAVPYLSSPLRANPLFPWFSDPHVEATNQPAPISPSLQSGSQNWLPFLARRQAAKPANLRPFLYTRR